MEPRDEAKETLPVPASVETEPDFQPLVPGLERVSHDAFRKGTLSRRRIVRAAIIFVVALIIIVGVIWLTRPA